MNFFKRIFLKLIINLIYMSLLIFNHLKCFLRVINSYLILCSFKVMCFSLLIYTSVLVTFDYFSYPYVFKLNVNNNINGFDLPPISFCTETNVLFDKNKFIAFFNSSQVFRDFRTQEVEDWNEKVKRDFNKLGRDPDPNKWDNPTYWYLVIPQYPYPKEKFDKRKEFFKDLSFNEMIGLMIRANQMINCSAKLHSRYHSKEIQTQDCVQDFNVLESIYGNKDFGICYTFFDSNEKFYLKDNDYIEFDLSYENGPDFIRNPFFDFIFEQIIRNFNENVVIYVMVEQNFKQFESIEGNSIKLSRQGLEGELKFTKTAVNYISSPYMNECHHYGKFIYSL